jgi:hypothetical protein
MRIILSQGKVNIFNLAKNADTSINMLIAGSRQTTR